MQTTAMRVTTMGLCMLVAACEGSEGSSSDSSADPTTGAATTTASADGDSGNETGNATTDVATTDGPIPPPPADSGDESGPTPPDTDDGSELDAPDNAEDLVEFLDAMAYADWAAEPDYHDSSGPHGGGVKVFYSPKAAAALTAGDSQFPAGAATVKELTSEGFLYGWAVWVKVQDATDAGNGFYWYELIRGESGDEVYGDALGSPDCVGCHSAGFDYLLSDGTFD